MIALKRQLDLEKEKQLEKQAQELEQLKTMMKTKANEEKERREFDTLKTQLYSLQHRLGEQATMEAEEEAKAAKRSFGGRPKTNNGAMIPDRSVYFDDFARKQASPTRTNQASANQGAS